MKRTFLVIGFILVVISVFSQTLADSIRCALYESYVDDRMEDWPALIGQMKELPDSTALWQQEIFLAHYGLAGYYLGNDRKEEAKDEIDRALHEIEQAQARFPKVSSFYCLEASFHSLQIALSLVKAPFFYARHEAAMKRAQEFASSEPLLLFEQANMLFHMPRLFGGNKREAVQLYLHSKRLLKNKYLHSCDWFPLMIDVFLLKAYKEIGDEENFHKTDEAIRSEHGELKWLSRFLASSFVE